LQTSSTAEIWEVLAAAAAAESGLWRDALRPDPERLPVFSPLAPARFALALETIYEGYLVHYGRPRLFDPPGADEAVLLGDYLYAHGLVRVAETGELDAVAALADLISTCAHLRAEGAPGDGEAWVETCVRLGGDASTASGALAAHADRFG
jgi:hypothetical protein